MAARKPGRYLAPIALLVVGGAIALVVKDHVNSSSQGTTAQQLPGSLVNAPRGQAKVHHHRPRFYTVQSGDTLSSISQATGVPIPIIQTLNPGLNPNALQTGQRLRLRR